MLHGDQLEAVSQLNLSFNSIFTLDGEIKQRVPSSNSHTLSTSVWSSRALTLSVKVHFFQCTVMSVLLHAGETWAVVSKSIIPLAVFQMDCFLSFCGLSLHNRVPKTEILKNCSTFFVESQLQSKGLGG